MFTRRQRSAMMAQVRTRHTGPELAVRYVLHREGFRYRLHDRKLPGVPDIVLPRYRTAIFIHGCFWHQHQGCKKATLPKQNAAFWRAKLTENRARGKRTEILLGSLGWHVIVLWECQVKNSSAWLPCVRLALGSPIL